MDPCINYARPRKDLKPRIAHANTTNIPQRRLFLRLTAKLPFLGWMQLEEQI